MAARHTGALFPLPLPRTDSFAYLFVLCIAQALLGEGLLALSPSR